MKEPTNKYIAYKGKFFTIEWYYDENGNSEPRDYFFNLDAGQREKFYYLFRCLGDLGKIWNMTKFRSEGDKLFAFKEKPDRLLCFFFIGKKVVITHAFKKKMDKLSASEKHKALNRMIDYEDRFHKGIYYEKH